jgi:hypothetical protein
MGCFDSQGRRHESLTARQTNGTTNADIGRIGSALDLVI